jgi:hypothetical protein
MDGHGKSTTRSHGMYVTKVVTYVKWVIRACWPEINHTRGGQSPKTEIRVPKEARIPKSENGASNLGFLSDFGDSDLGLFLFPDMFARAVEK